MAAIFLRGPPWKDRAGVAARLARNSRRFILCFPLLEGNDFDCFAGVLWSPYASIFNSRTQNFVGRWDGKLGDCMVTSGMPRGYRTE